MKKIQHANISARTLDFFRPVEISHWRIICEDLDHRLPWCDTDMTLCMFWGEDKIKNWKWNIFINKYPRRNSKGLLIKILSLSRWYKKQVHVLLTVLGLVTINRPNFKLLLLEFGTSRGILGASAQIMRPVASEQLLHLCHSDVPKYSSWL